MGTLGLFPYETSAAHSADCFFVSLFSTTEGWSADFQKGWDAYMTRDHATALRDWEPLAKEEKADVQNNLNLE